MQRWIPFAAAAAGLAALATISVAVLAMRRWQLATEDLIGRLSSASAGMPDQPRVVSFAALATLPPPVERYFRSVLCDGQRYVRSARIVQTGRFNMKSGGDDWHEYDATQFYHVDPPGYVWDARIRMVPFLDVRVRDAYAARQGAMRGAVLGIVDVVNEHDRPELDEGALQRYLAEAAMFPTALLPEQGVRWTPIDETRAAASLTDGTTTARLEFAFAPTGEILTMSTPRRYQVEKGAYVRAPWGGRYGRYEVRDGMRVPSEAEVYWVVDGQERSYITVHVTAATYGYDR